MAERKKQKPKRKATKPRRRRVTTAEISDRLTGITSELDQLRARIEDVAERHARTMGRVGDVEHIIEQATKGGRRARED